MGVRNSFCGAHNSWLIVITMHLSAALGEANDDDESYDYYPGDKDGNNYDNDHYDDDDDDIDDDDDDIDDDDDDDGCAVFVMRMM